MTTTSTRDGIRSASSKKTVVRCTHSFTVCYLLCQRWLCHCHSSPSLEILVCYSYPSLVTGDLRSMSMELPFAWLKFPCLFRPAVDVRGFHVESFLCPVVIMVYPYVYIYNIVDYIESYHIISYYILLYDMI